MQGVIMVLNDWIGGKCFEKAVHVKINVLCTGKKYELRS